MALRARRRKALAGVARVGTGLTGMHSLGRLAQDLAAPRFRLPYFSDGTLVCCPEKSVPERAESDGWSSSTLQDCIISATAH